MMPAPVLAQVESLSLLEEIVQLTIQGLALGAIYALIALGFVIIYKATEVINFAHGGLMMVGTYLVFTLVTWWSGINIGLRFVLAVATATVAVALLGVLIERTVLRQLIGRPVFAIVLVTLGLELILATLVQVVWGPQQKALPSPFPVTSVVRLGNIAIPWSSIWAMLVTAVVMLLFFVFFRYTKYGVGMRATAFDQEAAMAMGIKGSTIFAMAWAIGGGLAAIAGALFVPNRLAGFIAIAPVRFAALNAFPAAILGGLDSPFGAVVGGLSIGVAQVFSARFLNPVFLDWGLPNLHIVFPYILMIIVLMIRPYGLFGTREVVRV